ncbi:MAG: ribonuclease Y [Patescibacteria group bacterium]
MNIFFYLILGIAFGILISVLFFKNQTSKKDEEIAKKVEELSKKISEKELEFSAIEHKLQQKKDEAEIMEKEMLISAKEKAQKIIDDAKNEIDEEKKNLQKRSERIEKEEERIDSENRKLELERENIELSKENLEKERNELAKKTEKLLTELERISGLKKEEAKNELLKKVEEEERDHIAEKLIQIQKEFKEKEKNLVEEIIGMSIQRYAPTFVSDTTTVSVPLGDDEMKGRIIGKEGRNIKVFEEATGTNILIDDTPGHVVISCFEPIRREIAKFALEQLIKDGRIQPSKIEEAVQNAKNEIAKIIKDKGEEALNQLGLSMLDPKLVRLIGRLFYRTSYGQNVLAHSVETAEIGQLIAREIGYKNIEHVKLACLLHDIGKSVDRELEGTHIEIGVQVLEKHKFPTEVIHAVHAHHEDINPETVLDFIVIAADAISSSRPGARRDSFENYIKRLEGLENIAKNYPGVDRAYAISAGREIRIFVRPEEVDDSGAIIMASEIAKEIEKNLTYPGQIKVNIIRDVRAVEYAR